MSANNFLSAKKYWAVITSALVFIIYLFTLAPSVVQIDAGELATVQSTLGIAHPTGYPIFTILGYIFSMLPLPFTKIFQLNLLAAVWCALGIFFFIKSSQLLLTNTIMQNTTPAKKKRFERIVSKIPNDILETSSAIAPYCAAIVLAFSKTFWAQSTSVEVYSLQIFLFMLIIFFTLKAYYTAEQKIINWIYVAITLAFGFSNHMTTLLVLPFIAVTFFQKEKFTAQSFKKIFLMLAVFIPLLTLFYSFLPWRSSANPTINWGNPINWENFFRHVSGKQYQVWLFSSIDAAKKQLSYFLEIFPLDSALVGFVFGLIGIFFSFKTSRKIFYAIAATFLFAVLYSINYDIVDIDSYFLLAFIMFSFFTAFGFVKSFLYLHEKFAKKNFSYQTLGLIALLPLFVNFTEVNQNDVYTFEDYTRNILKFSETNSLLFTYQWDYLVSPAYYFQQVENYRKDVAVIDKELLRRSWYFNQLKRNHPDVIKNLSIDIENFLAALQPFERSKEFDSELLEKNYRIIMTKLITENYPDRNYYIGLEFFQNEMQHGEFSLPEGYQLVPHLFMFKVVKGNDYVPAPDPNFTIRFPKERNKYINFIENAVATMLTYRASYELQFNKPERAKIYLDKVRNDFPNFQIPNEIESRN